MKDNEHLDQIHNSLGTLVHEIDAQDECLECIKTTGAMVSMDIVTLKLFLDGKVTLDEDQTAFLHHLVEKAHTSAIIHTLLLIKTITAM